jgi:hypothetical protein
MIDRENFNKGSVLDHHKLLPENLNTELLISTLFDIYFFEFHNTFLMLVGVLFQFLLLVYRLVCFHYFDTILCTFHFAHTILCLLVNPGFFSLIHKFLSEDFFFFALVLNKWQFLLL